MAADKSLKQKIQQALEGRFENARVGVFDGYLTNIHAIVVSNEFDGLAEPARQDIVWAVLEQALTPGEVVKVSLALTFTPDEAEADRAFADHVGQ